MTESESVALPLGDTPISSYQYILADIADYIKHFLYLFQKIFNAGGARRRGGGGEDKATAPENEEAAPEGGAAVPESRATAPENRAAAPKDEAAAHKDVTAAIAFYIFFKNFSIPRKRRGKNPAF